MNEWILPLLLLISAFVALLVGRTFLVGLGNWFAVWMRGTCAILCLGFALVCGMVIYDTLRFDSVAHRPIATVTITKLDERSYVAEIADRRGDSTSAVLQGDAWQIGLVAVKWHGLFGLLGSKPIYRLDAISSRYYAFDRREQGRRVSIAPSLWMNLLDSWALISHFEQPLKTAGIQLQESAASFMPLADGAIYKVHYQQDALRVVPINMVAGDTLALVE